MLRARVFVTLKQSILDPQGSTIQRALKTMGYGEVGEVRQGKLIELKLGELERERAVQLVEEMCTKLLANPVIEEYTFELLEG